MGGIDTEWGMTYQKFVLMYCFFLYSNSYDIYQFEGEDDVTCINTHDGRINYIQAKTGKLSNEEKKNIVFNWIKIKPTKNCVFSIFSEKGHQFDLLSMKSEILADIKSASSGDERSNIKEAYLACTINGIYDENIANNYLDIIINGFDYKNKISYKTLYADIFNFYKTNRIHNNRYVDFQIRKHLDLIVEKYLKLIADNIAESKLSKTPISIKASQVDEWIDLAKTTFGINGYNKRYDDFKKDVTYSIDDSKREVVQLRKLGISENSILTFLIDEVFYKDFKSFYEIDQLSDIESLENKAFNNFEKASIGKDLSNRENSISLFSQLVNKTIEDPLINEMSDPQYCSDGCYIYLTSDDARPNIQITWYKNNE